MVKRAVTSSYHLSKGEKLSLYIKKIVRKLSAERSEGEENSKRGFTLSKQAATEMELLIEHAINNIAYNAGAILKYNGAGHKHGLPRRAAQERHRRRFACARQV